MLFNPWITDFALASAGWEGSRYRPANPRRFSSSEMMTESLALARSESKSGSRKSAAMTVPGRNVTKYAAPAIHPREQENSCLIRRSPGRLRVNAPPGTPDRATGWLWPGPLIVRRAPATSALAADVDTPPNSDQTPALCRLRSPRDVTTVVPCARLHGDRPQLWPI